MNCEKILSGYELVSKGATKIEATLPESGVKNVFPTGSWLEQKQIQAAVEARKHLIEVERIEKSGALSHAVWREELMLAEVTQKVGGYWQYLGHNKGKQLFLRPEEALFLMEINCLQLKFHDVKVSLQQAYSLLLTEKITLLQYKVYASLSRLGYRVYRHEKSETIENESEDVILLSPSVDKANNNNDTGDHESNTKLLLINQKNSSSNNESGNNSNSNRDSEMIEKDSERNSALDEFDNKKIIRKNKALYGLKKLQKLKNRVLKPCNIKVIRRFFDTLPDLTAKHIVSIKAPQKSYIPNSINLNKTLFTVNLKNIQTKNDRPIFNDTNIYTNDEVNESHIRRLSNRSEPAVPSYSNFMFSNENFQYRQYNFWRPRQAYNYVNFNMLYQRQFLWYFNPRFQMPRFQTQYWQTNFNNTYRNYNYPYRNYNNTNGNFNNSNRNFSNNNRNVSNKSSRIIAQNQNLEEIKKLAARLKQLILRGNSDEQNILSLQRLIQSYNTKYKTRVRLSNDFNIIVEETIVDTIEIYDDGEPSRKRRRSIGDNNQHDDNLYMLKKFASQLKELEKNNKSSARHRRAFSKLLRTFNESYDEEYYLNESYEIENRQQITLDTSNSSSEEGFIKEPKLHKRKKLRNPFNILKRLSAKQNELCAEASTSKNDNCMNLENKKYSEILIKTFTKDWLPPEDDFGRAEVVSKEDVANEITDMKREEFLFDFLKIQNCNCDNWLDLKKSFFTSIKEAIAEFHSGVPGGMNNRINSIVKPGDSTDIGSILKKLRIIRTANAEDQCNIAVDFDVFNRDVQNFRKTKKPSPHFRIICFDETKDIPSGSEIASLHSKYNDNVIIVFAIVGIDSISYVQINPTNLPVYISNNT